MLRLREPRFLLSSSRSKPGQSSGAVIGSGKGSDVVAYAMKFLGEDMYMELMGQTLSIVPDLRAMYTGNLVSISQEQLFRSVL